MATNGKLPMNQMLAVLDSAHESDRKRLDLVQVAILVDESAPRSLVLAIKDALLPVQSNSAVRVALLEEGGVTLAPRPDVCIVIAGGSDDLVRDAVSVAARQGIPVAVVAESVLDVPELPAFVDSLVATIVSADEGVVLAQLARWIASATDKSTAIAANFPFCRRARVAELVRDYASKNAAIGAVGNKGGSDLVSMTTNQAQLALDIAASYGRPLSAERVQELVGVVTAGVGYRTVARGAGEIAPGLGWALNASIGYLGTVATANAIASHYEREDAGEKPLPRVRALAGSLSTLVSSSPTLYALRTLGQRKALGPGKEDA